MLVAVDPFELPESDAPVAVVGTTYPNGYLYRRALRVAGAALPGGETGLVLRFEETLPSFKSVANGGSVASGLGYDIVFTDVLGTQVPHELETYDPAAGTVGAWVALPDSAGGFDLDLWVYYGRPGVATPQDDPAGVWAGMLGCWRGGDYRDVTANARHMTATGAAASLAAGTILNQPAAVLSGAANAASFELATADAVAVLSGRAAVTSALLIKPSSVPTANADVIRWGGTTSGTGWLGHTFFATGTAWRNYVRTNEPGTVYLIGPDAIQAGHTYLFAAAWAAGTPAEQVIDGVDVTETRSVTPTGTSEPLTGTVTVDAGTLLRIGAGYGDNTGRFVPGAYGRYFLWPAKKSAAFLAFLDLAVRYPHAVYGIGDEDTVSDPDRSPILGPARFSVAAGGTTDLAVLSGAQDPDGSAMLAGTAAPAATLGTTSVAGTGVRYVAGATRGVDRFGVTATAGTKTARALATVTVGPGVVTSTGLLPTAPASARTATWELARLSTGSATITEGDVEATGVTLAGGRVTTGMQNNAIALVSVAVLPPGTASGMYNPPFTLSFDYWRSAADPATPPDSQGVFSQICLYRRNDGNKNLGSLGALAGGVWTADYSPIDDYYSNGQTSPSRATGLRLSFDTHSLTGGGSNQIRLKTINGAGLVNGPITQVEAALATFDFSSRSTWTTLTFNFNTDVGKVDVTAAWPGGGTTSQSWDDADIKAQVGASAVNVVLMAYANRTAKFRNVALTYAGGPGGGGGDEGLAPAFPAVNPSAVVNCTPAGLQAAYNGLTASQIAAGVTICVNSYGLGNDSNNVVSGGLTLGRSGTAAKPIVIRAGQWVAASSTLKEPPIRLGGDPLLDVYFPDSAHPRGTSSWTGGVTVSGDHNWVRGLRFNGGVEASGGGNRFNRCFHDGTSALNPNLVVDTGDGNMWDWCEWADFVNVGLQHLPNNGAKNAIVYRCRFNGQTSNNGSSGTYHMLGTSPATSLSAANTPRMSNIVVLDCWYSGTGTASKHQTATESWEAKVSGGQQIRCGTTGTFYYTDSKGVHNNDMKSNIRHGFENRVIACRMDRLIVRGRGNIVADCLMTGGNVEVVAGDETFTDWIAETYGTAHPNYPTAEDTDVVRCDSTALRLGYMESGPHAGLSDLPPTGTTVWGSPPSTSGIVYMNGAKNPVATATGQPSRLVTTFTIPTGGTWTLRAAQDLALAASWDATKVGPNASYSASDDA